MNEREKTAQVLADASRTLRTVGNERDFYMQKCAEQASELAAVRQRLEAEKLAAEAHEAGYYSDFTFPDLVGHFEKAAQEGRLPIIKEAMVAGPPSMGGQHAINNDGSQASAESELVGYLVGNVG
jgi:hypothetical protein